MRAQDPLGRTRGAPWPAARALVAVLALLGADLDDLVEGEPVGALDPLGGRTGPRGDRSRPIPATEHGRHLLVLGVAQHGGERLGVGDAVGARADAVAP